MCRGSTCIVENGLSQEVSRGHSTIIVISEIMGRTEQFAVAKYNARTGQN